MTCLLLEKMFPRLTIKEATGESFAIKDMGAAKNIIGMHITHDRNEKKLRLS